MEEWRGDEVDILPRIGEQAHHRHGHEGAHGAGVVVARQPAGSRGEVGRDVIVSSASGLGWSAGIVVLVHGQESGLVPNIRDLIVVHIIQSTDERRWPPQEGDESGHIVWNETDFQDPNSSESKRRKVKQTLTIGIPKY